MRITEESKIAVVGNLGHNGYVITKTLRRLGYQNAELFITCKNNYIKPAQDPRFYDGLGELPKWVKIYNTRPIIKSFLDGRKIFKNYDLIIAITLSPAYIQFFNKNFVAIATGSDLREFVFEKGAYPFLLRRAYKKCRKLFFLNPDHINAIRRLGLEKKSRFLPFAIEIEKYKEIASVAPLPRNDGSELKLFWPSTWSSRLKGSDKFIIACDELLSEGFSMKLTIIDFSKSDEPTIEDKEMVFRLARRFPDKIKIIPRYNNRFELIQAYLDNDLIIDQFAIGSYGLLSAEASLVGRPVLTYFNFGESPFLNAFTSADIVNQIKNFSWTKEKAERARLWAMEKHGAEKVVDKLINEL